MKKLFSSGFFGLALLCFCLPWVTMSCSQQKIMTVTGIQMVSGMEVDDPASGLFGGPAKKKQVEPNVMAIVALVAAVAALVIGLIGGSASVLPALIGIATAVALKVNIDQDVLKQGQGLLQANFESGFIGYIFLMAGGGLTALIPNTSQSDVHADSGTFDTRKCPLCAEVIKRDALICKHCGRTVGGDAEPIPETGTSGSGLSTSTPIPQSCLVEEVSEAPLKSVTKKNAAGFCSECGTALIEDSLFCHECGLRVCAQA
jgi:hypothetical protein